MKTTSPTKSTNTSETDKARWVIAFIFNRAGMDMRTIGALFGVSQVVVLRWCRRVTPEMVNALYEKHFAKNRNNGGTYKRYVNKNISNGGICKREELKAALLDRARGGDEEAIVQYLNAMKKEESLYSKPHMFVSYDEDSLEHNRQESL